MDDQPRQESDGSPNPLMVLLYLLVDGVVVMAKTTVLLLVLIVGLAVISGPVVVLGPLLMLGYLVSMPFGGMYRHGVLRRYLRHKLTPLFAAAAVALCTAMVLIVISVMGGFLDMLTDSLRKLSGDITVRCDHIAGFPYYDELAGSITQLDDEQGQPLVEGAAPMVHTLGLLTFRQNTQPVMVLGVDPESFANVTNYRETLYWGNEHVLPYIDEMAADPRFREILGDRTFAEARRAFENKSMRGYAMGFELPPVPGIRPQGDRPGAVVGIEVPPGNRRDERGQYPFEQAFIGAEVSLTVALVTTAGKVQDSEKQDMVVVNEFKSGLYDRDNEFMIVDMEVLQNLLAMGEEPAVDVDGEPTGEILPARAHSILIKTRQDLSDDQLRHLRERIEDLAARHALLVKERRGDEFVLPFTVLTWKEGQGGQFLAAVQKEKVMMTFLFGIISMVAVVMIGVIFYMIAIEKTKDIGVMRAIGASQRGVASIFIGYGLAIGFIGALIGLVIAAGIVYNINEIQDLLSSMFGFTMWDPQHYFFEKIPARIDLLEAVIIVATAIGASMMGSIIPAIRAASLNPVESLRYE